MDRREMFGLLGSVGAGLALGATAVAACNDVDARKSKMADRTAMLPAARAPGKDERTRRTRRLAFMKAKGGVTSKKTGCSLPRMELYRWRRLRPRGTA
jgi:hypothetical protein